MQCMSDDAWILVLLNKHGKPICVVHEILDLDFLYSFPEYNIGWSLTYPLVFSMSNFFFLTSGRLLYGAYCKFYFPYLVISLISSCHFSVSFLNHICIYFFNTLLR